MKRSLAQPPSPKDRLKDAPSPRPLLEKLGVKADSAVRVIGVRDAAFREALERRTANIHACGGTPYDLIFYVANSVQALAKLGTLRRQIRDCGAIWIISRKGREAKIRHADVVKAATAAGLVDNKTVSFSATHTSLRLVVPLALRKTNPVHGRAGGKKGSLKV